VVALLIVAVIILGSMLMLHTAAVIDVQRIERSIEVSRENNATAARVVQAAREAAQRTFGPNGPRTDISFRSQFTDALSALEDPSVVTFGTVESSVTLAASTDYPSWSANVAALAQPSSTLLAEAGPQLRFMMGNRVAEFPKTRLTLTYSRKTVGTEAMTYPIAVAARLISVPLTRFALCRYDLPSEIGMSSESVVEWPRYFSADQVAPTGLVPARDPANVGSLTFEQNRPSHFRYLATLSEEYQYVFSQRYLQRMVDFAGATHYLKIGASKTNPRWSGAKETANGLALDLGEFGDGASGPVVAQKNCGVICSVNSDTQIALSDDGDRVSGIVLVIAGPADLSLLPTRVVFSGPITRPFVLVGYHISIEASSAISLNGAIFLDRDSSVPPTAGPFTIGHLSYWQGAASKVAVNAFRPGSLPAEIESLVPRVVYAVASEETL